MALSSFKGPEVSLELPSGPGIPAGALQVGEEVEAPVLGGAGQASEKTDPRASTWSIC